MQHIISRLLQDYEHGKLCRRGLKIRATDGSFHVQDPDGFEVQMGGKTQ